MQGTREEFSSRLGFLLAATGSAVGLGNVWGFPTNTASNGGAAFVAVYFILAFGLAYPALMAELVIGRHTRANIYSALQQITPPGIGQRLAGLTGLYAILVASAVLMFYTLVAGWVIAHLLAAAFAIVGLTGPAQWFSAGSLMRDLFCAGIFALLTIVVVSQGVHRGIERWSTRLLPALLVLSLALTAYVLFQPGAMAGLALYLVPDFSRILEPQLLVSAMGQAFFSLSLGVGTMLIYGSYLRQDENLPTIGALVTVVDALVAFLAGLLILPAMFVAQDLGISIYSGEDLIAGPDLIFQVLPTLFSSMGLAGIVVALAFFTLLAIAALTSSISMLEVPVALAVEKTPVSRSGACWLIGGVIFLGTVLLTVKFEALFGLVVTMTTEYSQPLLGIALCLFAGWVLNRNQLLKEIRSGYPDAENSLFWKIWPFYVRFVCPSLIAATFIQSVIL